MQESLHPFNININFSTKFRSLSPALCHSQRGSQFLVVRHHRRLVFAFALLATVSVHFIRLLLPSSLDSFPPGASLSFHLQTFLISTFFVCFSLFAAFRIRFLVCVCLRVVCLFFIKLICVRLFGISLCQRLKELINAVYLYASYHHVLAFEIPSSTCVARTFFCCFFSSTRFFRSSFARRNYRSEISFSFPSTVLGVFLSLAVRFVSITMNIHNFLEYRRNWNFINLKNFISFALII